MNIKKRLSFYFPNQFKTYIYLVLASVTTVAVLLFFIQITNFAEHFFKKNIVNNPEYGILTPFIFVMIVYFVKYSCDHASGSGLPQSLAALSSANKSIRSKLLSAKIAIIKMFFIFLAMLFGAPIGIEGPSIHVGSSIFYHYIKLAKIKRKFIIHVFIVAGSCVGMLVAFNAPLAAIALAYEEFGKNMSNRIVFMILLVIAFSYYVVFNNMIEVNYYLGDYNVPFDYTITFILQMLPLILFCGILGGIFSKIALILMEILTHKKLYRMLMIVFILGSIVAVFNYLSNGLTAGSGHVEIITMLNLESATAVRNLGDEKILASITSIEFVYMKFLATVSSMVTTIPGGIFIPSISIGAGIGVFFTELSEYNYILIIIIAMTAYLSAVIRMPITAALIILEMTNSLNLILPILVISFISSYVSSKVHKETLFHSLSKKFYKVGG